MKISKIFNLCKSQAELDFVDIDISKDTPLFLEPSFLAKRNDKWSIDASRTIKSFFQYIIDLIRAKRINEAKLLFDYLHEPNSTCLGLSKGRPQGRGVGRQNTDDIFDSIIKSKAITTGLIRDLEDNIIFVDDFGKDKLSDMTTNIIKKHLIQYTQHQCQLNNINLSHDVPSGYFWEISSNDWENVYTDILIIDNRKILLVPKGIVSYSDDYTPEKYYNHFVLNFLQSEHLRMNSALIQKKRDGTLYVTKKSIKEKVELEIEQSNSNIKGFLREFTKKHPQVFENFKIETKTSSLEQYELEIQNIDDIVKHLITKLETIDSGNDEATNYHRCIKGILELLFYPHLINPILEREIHQGRKRIDITFDNASVTGIFRRLSDNMRLPCQYLMFECKNYSSDPKNPELDQLAGRFSPNRGRVGFLLCRTIDDIELFINRCGDTYRDDRGLIIPLTDSDIITMLKNINGFDMSFIDKFISNRIREIMIN